MLMRKFLCSLLLVLSALFSMAQNYTSNGGTLEFVSGGSGNMGLVGCVGSDFSITIIDNDSEIATITADDTGNPTLTYANGQLSGNLTGTVSGTQYLYTVKDSDGDELGKFVLVVMDAPETPTITSTHTTFLAGEQYVFMASSNTSGVTYKWTLAGDGASIVGDNNMESVTVAFNSTLDQGTFQLICEVSNNGCTVVGSKNIEVSSGATQQDITYTALDATLCKGSDMAYTVTASESIPSTTTLKMTVGLESFTGYSKGDSYTFDLSGMTPTSGTFNAEIVDITNGTTIATPTITVNASPNVVISSTEQSFSTGTSYEFTATSDASNGTYMWSMGTYPDGGTYEFVNGYSSQSTTIKFNTTGQYELWCAVTDANGCSSSNFTYVTVEGGTVSDITYTAQPQVFCFYEGATYDTDFKVEVSGGEVPEGSTFHLTIGNSDIFTDRASSTIYFELPDTISAGTYDVTVWNADKTKQLCTSSLTVFSQGLEIIGSNEGVENTPLEFSVQNPGTSDDVTYKWRVLYYGSEDPAESSDYTFSNGNEGSTINVTFLNTGDYYIACQREGQCASGESTHYVEVTEATQSAVCSINGKNYTTLAAALEAAQSGDEIIVLNDIDEEEGNVDVNKSFTLNTNNHTVTFGIIHGMASRTITGGGVLNTALENSNTNGSNTLTIDNATLNLNGSQWMAKGLISLVNGASVTLTSEIFLGGGEEDGFNLSIDGTSSFNINGQNIGGYNCARIADQMSPYIPDNYTVSADGESLVFSPDANVILGAQPQQIERTYYVFGKAVACNGETTTVQIAAPQGFANAATLSITNADKLTFESSVVDTLLTVELPAGTYYLYDNSDDPVLEFSVETVTMSELEINGSDNVAIVGEMEQTNMGWSYYVPYTEGNTYEWTCSGDVSVTSERMGSSHWATVRFTTPGSYVLSCTETNANGCSQTVTKNVTVEQYTYTIPQNNVVMCSGDNASVTVIITCNTAQGFNELFAVAKDYTTDKLASYSIEEGDGMAKAHVTITEPGTYNLYYGGDEVDDVYYRDQINSLSFTVTEETITATISGPTTATVDEEVTYSVTASSTLPNATLTYSWGGGVENSLESDLMAVGSFSTSDIGEAEVFCLVESENGCSYEAKLAVTVEEAQPVVSVSFPQDEYEITIGDSTYVCLNITSEEPNYNLDLVTIALDDTEGGVQFMETQNKGCFYIKALSTAGSSTEVSATVTYNNKEYYATTLVRFKEAPFELENCPDAPLNFEDGSYELQISQWFDVSSYSYSWSSNNEDVATVGADGTVTFVAPGYAEILCTATNLYDQTGVVQAQCPLHIEGETEFTISEKSTLTVCQGESATVVITAEPAASFIVVSEDNETIYTADNEDYVTLTPTMTTAGDYTYYIVEDGTQKKSFTITVNEKPTVTITALQSVVCVGDTVQLEASMNLSDGSFFWDGADNFDDATSGNPKFVATYDGHYPISCLVTGACAGMAELSLQVYPKPTVTISGPTEATVDTEVEYTATLSTSNIPATATFTYAWGGGVESYDTETIAKGSFSESDIEEGAEVFCIVSTTDGTCVDTAKYPVTVKAVPATFWATDTVFCYDATGFVTIESSEAINTAAFGVQTADGTSVNFEPVVSPDNNQNNVVVIKYENIRNYGNGTYYITSKGEPVGSFQVVVNSVPRATFSCPTSDEAVVDETWNVSAPMAEGATYNYMWSSDGISFNDASSATQSITFETAGPVWVALSVEDAETGCVSNSDTCRFTIVEGEQKYIVPEEVTWCHGKDGGHVAFTVTSNKDIPESLTVNHEWASNIQVDVYGKEASIEFDYPYAGRQGFQLITINDDDNDGINDTTIVVENVNAYGKGYLQANIDMYDQVDTVVNFAESQEITLEVSCLETLDLCTSCGSGASFSWSYDEESIDGECLEWTNPDSQECNNSKMKFTFSQAGTYTFEARTHQGGCSSEWTSKTIYVVPFNPALFAISPEKDTIEIGDADGVQLTLSYDGEEYAGEYALRTDGDLTIDGSTVYDNEITGTFEVKAIVSDVVVAKAWITVNEVPITYTVDNVSVCEGTDEAVAVISASGSIYGRTVTVRDEDDNTFYPEYNDNNDAATLHLNYLSVGTYRYKVYENDVYKTEFTVTVNSLPRASIECPTDPVVGDTWSPNTAAQEGLSYAWVSDEIISLNGSTVCCPRVTFENAGAAKVIFTATDTQTGCSVSDSCEFEVADKPMECDNTLLSFGTTTEFIPYSVPVDEEISGEETFNLTFAGVANFSGPVQISLVDKFDGSYTTLGTVEFNVAANQAFSVNESMEIVSPTSAKPECVLEFFVPHHSPDFVPTSSLIQICESEFAFSKQSDELECNGYELTLGGEDAAQLESLYEEVAVGNVFAYQVEGVADFTGTIVLSLEEVNDSFAVADEQTYSVVKGEAFNFDGTFTVVNQEIDETMSFGMMIRRDGVDPEEISHLCLSDYSIERQIQSFAISEPKFNMFVGKTKNIVLMGDGEPYTRNYVEWNVIDMTGASANACVSVEDGNVTALSEGQAKIEAKVNGKVVATAMVSVSEFTCDGQLYSVTGDNAYFTVKTTSEIVAGETYRVELEGTTDFDGAVIVTCGDFSSEEPAQATGMGEIAVQAGVPFTYATMLTIQATASSTPNYNFMVALTGENEESRLCATKLEFTKFEPQYKFDESQYELSVNGGKLLVLKNSDGSVYGGDAEWYSSKQSVATVQNGYVTGISEGSTEIQVYVGGSLVATTTVVVYETTWFSIGFDEPGYVFEEVGEEQMICVNISGSFDGEINYEYDASIIELIDSQYGDRCKILKALKPGRSYFRASVMYDGEKREAGAAIEVEASTSDDYTLAFSQSKYEITEGESIFACLTIGEGFKQFNPQFNFDQTVISIANPTDGSDCGTITGLLAGHTFVEVIAAAPDGKSYSAQTEVIVNAKQLPYFVKQSIAIEVGESEQITVMIFDGGSAQASLFTFETSDATVATVGRDGVVTAIAVGNAEVSVFFEGSLVGKIAVAVDVAPQMPTPGYNTNVLTMCFDKSATTNGGTSLERMVYPTSDFGKLKWYDASGNELSAAPVVSAAQAGKAVYYVSQIGMGELANYRESEKVPYTVEIVYVAEPKLNVTDQSTCQGATAVPFVATTNTENVVEWTDVTGAVVAQGTEFLPQVPTSGYYTYKVTAKNTMGCVSNPLTVTYTVGNAVKPEIFVATQAESFVVGEPVTLGTSNQMSDEYSVVWSLGDNEYVHGTAFTTQFDEVGTYTVTCKVVETNTGCADSASKVITVEEKVIPLQSIVVEPETVTLYEGEQGYVSLAFEPSYASNMAYTIEVEDTEVADVAGLTVWAVAEGTTKATITSVENPDVKAEFNIVVNKLIKAKEISMPNIITLALNEETKVAASVIPAEASYNKVAFKEKTDNVISIDAEGNIKALGEGTSTIVAYSNGGLQATAVVYVTAAQTAITDIAVPDEIELKLRDSVVVSYKVTPVTLAAKLLEWAIENNDIATFSNGIVKAVSAGETNLTVSIGNISKTIKIKVTTSSAPIIGTAPKLAFEQGKNITVDFADFVSDDETELANLTFEVTSDDLNVSIDGTVATITAKSDSYAGTTSFTLSVTDEDGLTTSADVPVEVTEKANQAPVVLIEDVQIKYNACTYLNLSEIASDDFTSYKKLIFNFEAENVTLDVIRSRKYQLRMYTDDPDMEFDTLFVTVTDDAGLSTSAKIIMYVNSLPNRAPKIAEIPVQSETDDVAFGTIELANYVKDDYTAASSIKWTTSSSDNLSVTIDEGVASVEVLNAFWNGAEAITFYAADEDGLKDSTIVYYSRKVTINEETVSSGSDNELTPVVWEGAPVVNIMAMKFIGVPGEQFIIMASMSGYDCTWAWEIEGANGIDQTSLMQMVSFDNPGTYTVKLTVQSADGQHSIEVVKENLLTVVGINERTPAICKGDAVTLTASEGLDSYYWSTGDVKNTTTARPDATTLYKLTMKKGMFTLVDTVTVKVSVPVALMEDSVMCAGTTFDLEAIGDYVSYAWNTGDVEKSITIPSEVASYTVTAVDGMQCVSVDTFNLTKVNDLPAIDLGEDQTPCDGTTVTLDAGAGYEYLWSNGSTEQTISLTANTETVWARIIDANKCINYDTVVVAFTYPYPEQIGVATFSETTDHIILAWEKTAGVNTVSYAIERETGVTGNWEQVGDDVMFSESGIVVDEDVNYKETAFKYRLVTTDACGNKAYSEPHRSMVSSTMWQTNGLQTIHWTAYKPFANVTQYKILRGYEATQMDTVIDIPASDDEYFIWNETDPQYTDDINVKYRVVFRLKSEVNENAVNTLDGQPVEGYYTKAESGPFSLAMSNIAEVETDVSVSEIAFPADVIVYPTTVSSYINVAIASPEDNNFIVEVLNANGQVVAKVQTGEISKTLLQISAEGLRQGVYTVRISDGQQSTSVKVVK